MRTVLAVLMLGLLAAALTACGVGAPTDEENVSKTATTYLRALADGDTAKACAQFTRRAKGRGCDAAVKERLSRLEPDALKNAADASMDIDVDNQRATAGLSEPEGARFLLAKVTAASLSLAAPPLSWASAQVTCSPTGVAGISAAAAVGPTV